VDANPRPSPSSPRRACWSTATLAASSAHRRSRSGVAHQPLSNHSGRRCPSGRIGSSGSPSPRPASPKQVRRRVCRDRAQCQMLELRPYASRIGPPSAEEEADATPATSQHVAIRTPARTSVAGVSFDHSTHRGRSASSTNRTTTEGSSMPRATDILPVVVGHSEAHPRRNGQADKVTAHDPSPAQLLDHVRTRLSHEPTLPPSRPTRRSHRVEQSRLPVGEWVDLTSGPSSGRPTTRSQRRRFGFGVSALSARSDRSSFASVVDPTTNVPVTRACFPGSVGDP